MNTLKNSVILEIGFLLDKLQKIEYEPKNDFSAIFLQG